MKKHRRPDDFEYDFPVPLDDFEEENNLSQSSNEEVKSGENIKNTGSDKDINLPGDTGSRVRRSALEEEMEEWRRAGSQRKDYDRVDLSSDEEQETDARSFSWDGIRNNGGSMNTEGNEIRQQMNLGLEKRKRMHTNAVGRVLENERKLAGELKRISWQAESEGTSTGQGVRFTQDNILPFTDMAAGAVRDIMADSMRKDLGQDEKFRQAFSKIKELRDKNGKIIFEIKDMERISGKDIKRLAEGSAMVFKQAGITKLSRDPELARIQIQKAVLSGRIKGEEAEALAYVAKRVNQIKSVSGKKPIILGKETGNIGGNTMKFSMRKTEKYLNQDDTGRAMVMTGKLTKLTRPVLKNWFEVFGFVKRMASIAYKNTMKSALQAAVKMAEEKISSSRLSAPLKKTKETAEKTGKAVRTGTQKVTGAVKSIYERAAFQFTGLKKWMDKKLLPIKNAGKIFTVPFTGRFSPFRFLGKMFSGLSYVKKMILGFLSLLLTMVCIIVIVISVIAYLVTAINFGAKEENVQDMIFDAIDDCYEEQLSIISSYSQGDYGFVSIKEENRKSNKAYEGEKDFAYTETTNSTELISMAIIYFEGDLDQFAGTGSSNELVTYVKGMYYGSHDIDVNYGDDSTEVTVTTYYFDDLFECEPKDGFSDYSMQDGTGQLVKVKIRAASMGQVKCSAYGHPDIDSLGGSPEPNSVAYYTAALLRGDFAILQKYGIRQGSFIVLKIPSGAFPNAGISGNLIYRIGSAGSYGSGRVFDLYFDHEKEDMNHFGVRTLSGYVPDDDADQIIEAWVVDNGEIDQIPGLVEIEDSGTGDASQKAQRLLSVCDEIGSYISANNSHFYNKSKDGSGGRTRFSGNFKKLKEKVGGEGKSYNVDCAVIRDVALKTMGVSLSSAKKLTTAHGKNIQKAVKDGNLVPGDIVIYTDSYSNLSHTLVYKGTDSDGSIFCYESGGACRGLSPKYSNHCVVDYKNRYKSYKIDYIRRFE